MTNNDSLAVKVPYNKAKIASLIENEFNFDLEKYDAKPYLKNSMLSTPLSYMGYGLFKSIYSRNSNKYKNSKT